MKHGLTQEKPVNFTGPAGLIEGRLANAAKHSGRALVMLHPHPLYGGSMQNNVADAVILAALRCGFATLRFNFRGVGQSHGQFDHGVGEADDVAAAVAFMALETGSKDITLAGYSFGASVALTYCHSRDHGVNQLFLVAPPPSLLEQGITIEIPETKKIILGELDEIASPADVRALLTSAGQAKLLEIIPGANHLFGGKAAALKAIFEKVLTDPETTSAPVHL